MAQEQLCMCVHVRARVCVRASDVHAHDPPTTHVPCTLMTAPQGEILAEVGGYLAKLSGDANWMVVFNELPVTPAVALPLADKP